MNAEIEQRLYELNCANAEWHEATGDALPSAQRRFQDALQWFKDRKIAIRTEVDATMRGVYVLEKES